MPKISNKKIRFNWKQTAAVAPELSFNWRIISMPLRLRSSMFVIILKQALTGAYLQSCRPPKRSSEGEGHDPLAIDSKQWSLFSLMGFGSLDTLYFRQLGSWLDSARPVVFYSSWMKSIKAQTVESVEVYKGEGGRGLAALGPTKRLRALTLRALRINGNLKFISSIRVSQPRLPGLSPVHGYCWKEDRVSSLMNSFTDF